ncbi:hypothetical protein METP3_03038 [Methanosarcinales archaeon]|nr:hypothetical protein METP3_03038 [Methanosarcinales archaeon]
MYDCPCGKKHKSRDTVNRHKKKQLGQENTVRKPVRSDVRSDKSDSTIGQSFFKEINLKGEFDKMAEVINPKKEETKEAKYECGSCHQKFNDKYKRCPHCGVEFE